MRMHYIFNRVRVRLLKILNGICVQKNIRVRFCESKKFFFSHLRLKENYKNAVLNTVLVLSFYGSFCSWFQISAGFDFQSN